MSLVGCWSGRPVCAAPVDQTHEIGLEFGAKACQIPEIRFTVRTGTFVNPHMSLPRSATPLRVLRKHASRRRLLLRMECCSRRSVRFHVAAGAVLVDAWLYERVQVTRLASRATPSRKVCGEQLERFVKRLDSRHYTGHPASTQLIRTIN